MHLTRSLLCGLLCAWLFSPAAHAQDFKDLAPKLQLPPDFNPSEFQTVYQAPKPPQAPDPNKAAPVQTLRAAHVGKDRLLFHITFAANPQAPGSHFILYLDLDDNKATGRSDSHAGVDVMVSIAENRMALTFHNPAFSGKNTTCRFAFANNDLYITLATPIPQPGPKIALRAYGLSEREFQARKSGHSTKASDRIELARADRAVELLRDANEKPPVAYRFANKVVKYEALEEKGLKFAEVAPAQPFKPARPTPRVPFNLPQEGARTQTGSIAKEQIPVNLLEEAGVDRAPAHLTFGLPLPRGGLFDTAHIVLLDPDGRRLPIQVAHTSLWPDRSIKWALIDAFVPLKANQSRRLVAQFGHQVPPVDPAPSPLRFEQTDQLFTVFTGPLKVQINKRAFNVIDRAWLDRNADGQFAEDELVLAGDPTGLRLEDQSGRHFSSASVPPARFEVEEAGPHKLVLRVEGPYAAGPEQSLMRHITRLTFLANSPVVTIAHTHINDSLQTEFTDITSLNLPFKLAGDASAVDVLTADPKQPLVKRECKELSLSQWDDRTGQIWVDACEGLPAERYPGVLRVQSSRGALGATVHEFWQRWPKSIAVKGRDLTFGLLPPQPRANFGDDLPYHLMYPFVGGKYRFKWGSAFTTRISLDCSGNLLPAQLGACADKPVVAVLPASWYARTAALGDLAAPEGRQFALWDQFMLQSYAAHIKRRDQQREYGYMNYGDFFGERGRNWGNNEYDRAHGFFMQFARTGNRDYFRIALEAARHQADADIVHAYPDPYYVGANHQHSIGHTGQWSQVPPQATWSHKYDAHTDAGNGHTWSHGMVDAWFLTGDARVMESAQELGEHIAFAMAPRFRALGSHERSAGWSLRAIIGLYRVGYDPAYLHAADQIAAIALEGQKADQGGAWAHVLPLDHALGQKGVMGNNTFILAILLNGLALYHEETGKPEVLESLKLGTGWLVRSWNAEARTWPYSASPEGKAVAQMTPSLNPLMASPVAYVAMVTNDAKWMSIVEQALPVPFDLRKPESFGKTLAQHMVYTPETLYCLQRFHQQKDPAAGATLLSEPPASPRP